MRFVCTLLLCSLALFAQSDRGSITGRVLDPSGAAVPAAQVTATNTATNVRSTTRTSETGNYLIPQLPVGVYEISVEAPGFKKALRRDLTLNIAQTLALDLALEVGAVEQSVEVVAGGVQLETSTSDVGTLVSRERVMDLPLAVAGNMRNPEAFIFLTPGVSGTVGDTNINGSQSRAKEVILDGAGATSPESGGTLFTYPSVEAISEFKLVGANFNAEFGRTGGGFQVFTTKSGTNQFHGALFDYFRNDALDARGFYARTTPVNRQNEFGANLGGPIKIPGLYDGKDKSFFFFNYTGFRYRAGALNEQFTLPTDAMRQGDFSALRNRNGQPLAIYDPSTTRPDGSGFTRDPFPNALIPQSRFSAVSAKILPDLPANSNSSLVNNFLSVGAQRFDKDQVNFRVDHNFSDRNRSSFFAYIGDQKNIDPERLPVPFTAALDRTRKSYWLRFNHDTILSPTTLNHFIYGFTREGEYFTHLSANQSWPAEIGLTGVNTGDGNRFPRVGFTDGLTGWGQEPKTAGAQVNNAFQVNNSLSHVRGNHSMKFGLEARWLQTNGADPANSMGTFNFNSLETALPTAAGRAATGHAWASFLLGNVNNGNYDALFVVPANRYRYLAFFAQDDWRVSRKLTLNYGFRYDIYFTRFDAYGNMSGFDPSLPNPGAGNIPGAIAFLGEGPGRDSSRKSFADNYYKNFGPRLGLAYSIDSKTVLRAGYGIFYGPGNATTGLRSSQRFALGFNAAPSYATLDQGVTPAFNWDGGFPANWPRPPFINPTVGNGTSVYMMLPADGRPPYFQNWSANIQREVPGGMLLDVGYVAVKGTRLGTSLIRPNEVDPGFLYLGNILTQNVNSAAAQAAGIVKPYPTFNGSVAQALREFPQVLDINANSQPNGNSTYHSFQTKLERRMANGITWLGAYTWSKSISDGNVMAGGGVNGQTAFNRRLEKTISTMDVPHTFAFSGLYELPWGKGKRWATTGFASHLAGGWSLTGILQYSAGAPLVLTANNTLGLFNGVLRPDVVSGADRASSFSDPATDRWINPAAFGIPGAYRFGTSARSYSDLRSPAFLNESFGLLKRTPLGERLMLVFRAEFFNAFNRTVFRGAASNISAADFGRISAQANTPRQGQFALRLEF